MAINKTLPVVSDATPSESNRLLTVKEAAHLLGISPGTLYHWLSDGKWLDDPIPVVRFSSRCVRFPIEELRAWCLRRGYSLMQVPQLNSPKFQELKLEHTNPTSNQEPTGPSLPPALVPTLASIPTKVLPAPTATSTASAPQTEKVPPPKPRTGSVFYVNKMSDLPPGEYSRLYQHPLPSGFILNKGVSHE